MTKIIVLGNEKGGSGKSTTAMHLIVALAKTGNKVASMDLISANEPCLDILKTGRITENDIKYHFHLHIKFVSKSHKKIVKWKL